MADRKKVQKIRTKRAVKFKAPKKSVKKQNKPIDNTERIQMKPEKVETHIYSKNQKLKPAKNKARTSNRAPRPNNNLAEKTLRRNRSFSVIVGKKVENQKKKLITACISFFVIAAILIFCLTSPTGPIERITNAFATMGGGEFPTVLTGTKVLSLQTINNKAFALTNSHLCGYNYRGKNFLLLQHNFSNPVLDVSEERALVYNRESNKFIIANNNDLVFEQSVEQSIFCADISYNGSVAFVCDSASFSAQVIVFDKNMEQYYTWYLADGLVSDITVSDNGKYVALAVLKVENGAFSSEIYCLNTSEKEPVFVKKLSDETVMKIESVSSTNFVYTSNKKVSFISWKTGEIINKNNFDAPAYFNNASNYHLALYGEANHSDIILYNSKGEIKHQFEYNGIIDDISVFDESVFILSGNKITCFDFYSENKNVINLESKPDYILGIKNGIATINNANMELYSTNSNN